MGVDVGGTGIKGAPVDTSTGVLTRERIRLLTPHPATPEAVAGVVAELVEQLECPGPLGVTLPAVVQHGVARTAANIDAGWIDADAAGLLAAGPRPPGGGVNDAPAARGGPMGVGAGAGVDGVVVMVTLGTGIGSAVFVDGTLVPNTELGHLPLHGGDAEDWAAASVREEKDLGWKKWAHRVEAYLQLLEKLLWPDLIIIGGGVSKHADRFLPHIETRTAVVPAELHNNAGIAGAALFAPAD